MKLTKWIRFWYWLNYGRPMTREEWASRGISPIAKLLRLDRFDCMEERRREAKRRRAAEARKRAAEALPFAGACGPTFRLTREEERELIRRHMSGTRWPH